jgi:DNA invertase Pin-like site-specific DNA recombinase
MLKFTAGRICTGQHPGTNIRFSNRCTASGGSEKIYEDKISGMKASKPEFELMIGFLRKGDTIVIWKPDDWVVQLAVLLNWLTI